MWIEVDDNPRPSSRGLDPRWTLERGEQEREREGGEGREGGRERERAREIDREGRRERAREREEEREGERGER